MAKFFGTVELFDGENGLIVLSDGRKVYMHKFVIRKHHRAAMSAGAMVRVGIVKNKKIDWNGQTYLQAHEVERLYAVPLSERQRRAKEGSRQGHADGANWHASAPTNQRPQGHKRIHQLRPHGRKPTACTSNAPAPINEIDKQKLLASLRQQVADAQPALLKGEGADLDLVEAVKKKDFDQAALHLIQGENPNQRDEKGNTALAYAVVSQEKFLVELLLLFNANPKVDNASGISPLSLTLEHPELDWLRRRLAEPARDFLPDYDVANTQKESTKIRRETQKASLKSAAERLKTTYEEAAFYQEGADKADGSRHWGQSWRDNGAFGSHPGFDDYGDESMP